LDKSKIRRVIITTQIIREQVTQLTLLHDTLLAISKNKTESIKTGDMDQFTKLLMQERKQLQAIEQLEEKRQQEVERVFNQLGVEPNEKTISELMIYIDDEEEKEQLDEEVTALVNVIVAIRQNEQLNQELIQQSMQFIQLSLDMLQPATQSINYNEKNERQERVNRSVFDSRA